MLGILGPYRSTNSAYSLHLNVDSGTLGDKKCWPKWTEVCLEQGPASCEETYSKYFRCCRPVSVVIINSTVTA